MIPGPLDAASVWIHRPNSSSTHWIWKSDRSVIPRKKLKRSERNMPDTASPRWIDFLSLACDTRTIRIKKKLSVINCRARIHDVKDEPHAGARPYFISKANISQSALKLFFCLQNSSQQEIDTLHKFPSTNP